MYALNFPQASAGAQLLSAMLPATRYPTAVWLISKPQVKSRWQAGIKSKRPLRRVSTPASATTHTASAQTTTLAVRLNPPVPVAGFNAVIVRQAVRGGGGGDCFACDAATHDGWNIHLEWDILCAI